MTTWYSLPLGDAMMAHMALDDIRALFESESRETGQPFDLAVFTRLNSEGRLHCHVTAYFSPAAARLARSVGAEPCAQPVREGLELFAGNRRSWSVLFAGQAC